MEMIKKMIKYIICAIVFVLGMTGFNGSKADVTAYAEEVTADAPAAVQVKEIDYEEGYVLIDTKGNTKVYYSDSKQTTWTQIEGNKSNDCLKLDISWISVNSDYELNLKGSDEETVVSVELPKRNKSLKVTFDKVDGILDFTNEDGADYFEWRKSTAIGAWSEAPINLLDAKEEKDVKLAEEFKKQIETMRVKGGKISVRIPQKKGTSENDLGSRPSNTVTVSITKRGNAPSVKVTANTLKTNTTTAMEYRVRSVGGTQESMQWTDCEKSMTVSALAADALATATDPGKTVVVEVRKAETAKVAYSKSTYLEIPGQRVAPSASVVSTSKTTKKYTMMISDASTANPYQYVVVKAGKEFDVNKATWKNVTSSKGITFASSTYPEGSKIYLRLKGKDKTTSALLQLPSAYTEVSISYLTEQNK